MTTPGSDVHGSPEVGVSSVDVHPVAEVEETDEYARFESLARQLVNTPKLKPSATDLPLPVDPGGEPADDGAEREEPDRYGD